MPEIKTLLSLFKIFLSYGFLKCAGIYLKLLLLRVSHAKAIGLQAYKPPQKTCKFSLITITQQPIKQAKVEKPV